MNFGKLVRIHKTYRSQFHIPFPTPTDKSVENDLVRPPPPPP